MEALTHRSPLKPPARQLGQSLTELLIALVTFLVPTLLIVPILAQMVSLKQTAESSARYVAWERTVWLKEAVTDDSFLKKLGDTIVRSDTELAEQVDRRLLSEPSLQIYTSGTDGKWTFDPFMKVQNPAEDEPVALMELAEGATDDVPKFSKTESTDSEVPGKISETLNGILGGLGYISSFDLNLKGYIKATYEVALIRMPWLEEFDQQALFYKTSNTILTDSWNPTGRDHAESRISGLLPQEAVPDDLVEMLQSGAAIVPWFKEVAPESLIVGHTNVDPVPAHRLSEYE